MKMKYRKMGSLDWKVSALGFGAMRLPLKMVEVDGKPIRPGEIIHLQPGEHIASFSEDVTGGMLVLALSEPPGFAPLDPMKFPVHRRLPGGGYFPLVL